MILDEIVSKKKERVAEKFKNISIESLKMRVSEGHHNPAIDFKKALQKEGRISIIAEIKKASPSKGVIKNIIDPVEIAMQYRNGGADAISVLTEEDYFLGCDEYLIKVRQRIPLPILRKDFIIDIRQVYQSRLIGADAILLITSILTDEQLNKFQVVAKILGMSCLVEVHNEDELKRALRSGASIIGINNRDLKTFEVNLETTERLIKMIPKDRIVVSESGISTSGHMQYLMSLGVNAVLAGESLMRAESIENKLQELSSRGVD